MIPKGIDAVSILFRTTNHYLVSEISDGQMVVRVEHPLHTFDIRGCSSFTVSAMPQIVVRLLDHLKNVESSHKQLIFS